MNKRRVATFGVYLGIVLASAAALAGIELALRSLFPDKIDATADYEVLEPDPVLGYRLKSSVNAVFQRSDANGGDLIHWSTNRDGYRGDALGRKGAPRVVVYGDSNVQAIFSSLPRTFPKQLEMILARNLEVAPEVINAGVMGYGPDHYLLRMSEGIDQLNPELVILTVFADNDLGDPLRHRLFELRDGELVKRSDHFIYPARSMSDRLQGFAARLMITKALNKIINYTLPEPQKNRAIDRVGDSSVDAYIGELQALVSKTLANYLTPYSEFVRVDHYDIDVATNLPAHATSISTKVNLLRAILSESKRKAEAAKVSLVVVILPSRVDLSTSGDLNYRILERFPGYDRRRLSSTVRAVCDQLAIESVDLFDAFASHGGDHLYFRGDDTHWNDEGQALAARTVAPLVEAMLRRRSATR
jgi:lysophospholipase L1-like esterase